VQVEAERSATSRVEAWVVTDVERVIMCQRPICFDYPDALGAVGKHHWAKRGEAAGVTDRGKVRRRSRSNGAHQIPAEVRT
jgi:hypothetical protein